MHINTNHLRGWTASQCQNVCVCARTMRSEPQSKQRPHRIGFISDSETPPSEPEMQHCFACNEVLWRGPPPLFCQDNKGEQRQWKSYWKAYESVFEECHWWSNCIFMYSALKVNIQLPMNHFSCFILFNNHTKCRHNHFIQVIFFLIYIHHSDR